MKQLTIVVKPFRAEAVLRAIAELDVISCVVREAKGYSRQKGYLDRYAGSEYSMAFIPKVEISVVVSAARAEEIADHIIRAARTGRIGDGKVFVLSMSWPEPLEFWKTGWRKHLARPSTIGSGARPCLNAGAIRRNVRGAWHLSCYCGKEIATNRKPTLRSSPPCSCSARRWLVGR